MAEIYERDLGAIRGARHAEIEFEAYPGQRFEGKITYLGDVLDPESRTVKVRCVVPNPDSLLKLGMFATVRIPTEESRRLPAVPTDAVQIIDGNPVVFVETMEGTFEKRAVLTGREQNRMIVIEQGLEIGEVVVTEGSFALKSELLREQLGAGHTH
jgi:cobalt-zinc-cadmium efflux system membrane fusion protein